MGRRGRRVKGHNGWTRPKPSAGEVAAAIREHERIYASLTMALADPDRWTTGEREALTVALGEHAYWAERIATHPYYAG